MMWCSLSNKMTIITNVPSETWDATNALVSTRSGQPRKTLSIMNDVPTVKIHNANEHKEKTTGLCGEMLDGPQWRSIPACKTHELKNNMQRERVLAQSRLLLEHWLNTKWSGVRGNDRDLHPSPSSCIKMRTPPATQAKKEWQWAGKTTTTMIRATSWTKMALSWKPSTVKTYGLFGREVVTNNDAKKEKVKDRFNGVSIAMYDIQKRPSVQRRMDCLHVPSTVVKRVATRAAKTRGVRTNNFILVYYGSVVCVVCCYDMICCCFLFVRVLHVLIWILARLRPFPHSRILLEKPFAVGWRHARDVKFEYSVLDELGVDLATVGLCTSQYKDYHY